MKPTLALLVLLVSPLTPAAEFSRGFFSSGYNSQSQYYIKGTGGIGVVAASRPDQPTTQGLVRVYVNPEPWGMSACRQDAFDIPKSETLMIELVMHTGLQFVVVDDALPQVGGVCQAVFVRGQPRDYERW
jgi:hypothetical protein